MLPTHVHENGPFPVTLEEDPEAHKLDVGAEFVEALLAVPQMPETAESSILPEQPLDKRAKPPCKTDKNTAVRAARFTLAVTSL